MKKNKGIYWLLEYGIIFVLLILVAFFSIRSNSFFSANVLMTILKQVAITGIVSVGMTFVMLTGGIDLSVGAVAGLTGVIASTMMLNGVSSILACTVGLLVSALCGIINTFLITKCSLPPLIATLGVQTSARGFAYIVSGGFSIFNFSTTFTNFGKGTLWIIPYPVLLTVAIFLAAIFLLTQMKIGRYIYGVGGNEEASRLSGVNVGRIKTFAYMSSGLLSGVAGLVYLSRIGSGQAGAGVGYEMDAITAVVLGGISINGGEGKLSMVAVGVLVMGVLTTGMVMLNINDYVQQVVRGIVMVCAVAFSMYSKKVRADMSKLIQ